MAIIEELASESLTPTREPNQQQQKQHDDSNIPPSTPSPTIQSDPPSSVNPPSPVTAKRKDDDADNEPLASPPVVILDQDLFYDAAEDPAHLLAKATSYKSQGNRYFGGGDYEKALTSYQDAATLCPADQVEQRAVYAANMAACHLKLGNAKEAKTMCDKALDLDPGYVKARLRRAQANERIDSSAALSDALKDYQHLLDRHHGKATKKDDDTSEEEERVPRIVLDKTTLAICQRSVRDLPPKIKIKMEKEKDEMIGKLKDLGNTVLGKFGLSTDNFQFQKDPSSGNYSMNFVNSPSSS
jgi:tetratricopeptide (TPR) repeat protein